MRFFRSTWLQKILLPLLLVLLNAGTFDFIERQGEGKDELVIRTTQFFAKLSSPLRQLQIRYGFDVVNVSAVRIFKKNISHDYIPGTSCHPVSADLPTYLCRGPPRLTVL